MVQWLRLCAHNAGGLGLIPEQGARSHILQLRVHTLQLRLIKIFFLKMDRRSEHFAKKDIKIANKHMENYHRCYQETYAKGHHSTS